MNERCLILIDGSNFYFKLKDLKLHNLLSFNFTKFVNFLTHSSKNTDICYYVGRIKQDSTEKTDKLFNAQQKLIGNLKKHKIRFSLGYLLKSGDVFHEKGVDVQIAVDMVVAAYEQKFDKILVVSSDTDLAPAIKKAREKGKVVKYVGFSHMPSVAMVSFCTESVLLTKEDITKFIDKKKVMVK